MKIKVDGKTCPTCGNPGLELNYDNYTAHCPFCDYTGTMNIENDGIFIEVEKRKTMEAENEQARKNFEAINEQDRQNKAFEKELEEKTAQNKLKWAKIGVVVGLVVGIVIYFLSKIPALAIAACAITIPLFIPKIFGDNASLRHKIKLACGVALLGIVIFSGIRVTLRKKIVIELSSKDYIGKNYEDVQTALKTAGFIDISSEPHFDYEIEQIEDAGSIEKITINGNEDFTQGSEFPSNAKIRITYHDVDPEKIQFKITFSAKDLKGKDKAEVLKTLVEMGFRNIKEEPDYDAGLLKKAGTVEKVSIKGNSEFEKATEYRYDDNVVVTYYASEEEKEASEHEGEIKLTSDAKSYIKRDHTEVEKELKDAGFSNIHINRVITIDGKYNSGAIVEFSINGSTDFKKDSWFKPNAEIKIVYYEPQSEAEEAAEHPDEVKLPEALKEYKGRNYNEVVEALKEAGFTNITIEKSSDKGLLTKSGQVISITIDDVEKLDKGTWLNKNAKVVITYYEPKSEAENAADHPGQISVPESSGHYKGENYEVVQKSLSDAGFTNIALEEGESLKNEILHKRGDVSAITIAGNSSFSKGAWFDQDAQIRITYYKLEAES